MKLDKFDVKDEKYAVGLKFFFGHDLRKYEINHLAELLGQGFTENNAMTTKATGKVILKGKNLSLKECLPDDPVYKRGYVVGGQSMNLSSKGSLANRSSKSKPKKSPS